MLNEEQILENWEKFLELISNMPGKRAEILVKFYEENAERFSMMPASGNTKYHSAFPGGYIHHVLEVYSNASALYDVWIKQGAFVNDFTFDELRFTVLNHDLGKFGTDQGEYYIPQTSDWHRNRGEIYSHNGAIPFMKTSDRSLFILQSLGVNLSENEYMAIKLHDGLYEESNKSYLVSYNDDYRLRPHLSYILHQADLMAARIEYDQLNRSVTTIKMNYDQKFADPKDNIVTTTNIKNLPVIDKIIKKNTEKYKAYDVIEKSTPKKVKTSGKYSHLLK